MKRIVPGVALAIGWLILLLYGSFSVFSMVVIILGILGGGEYVRMVSKSQDFCGRTYLLVPLYLLPLIFCVVFRQSCSVFAGLMISYLLLTVFILANYSKIQEVFLFYCKAVFGLVYIGGLTSCILLLYLYPQGSSWLILLAAVTAGSDTGAYGVGKLIGRHKLCPNVSPKKTIEGALGGIMTALLLALIFGRILFPSVSLVFLGGITVFLSLIAILGDLTESIIKRGTDCKDSGTILGGHGGIMDRMDSMLFSAPVLYFLLLYVGTP